MLKREGSRIAVGCLKLHLFKVNTAPVKSSGRPRLETSSRQSERRQSVTQSGSRSKLIRTGAAHRVADNDARIEKGTGTENHIARHVKRTGRRNNTLNFSFTLLACHKKPRDLLLNQREKGFRFEHLFHPALVARTIHLRARRHDCRTFCRVQHTILDHMAIRQSPHLAAEGVDLPDHLTFCRAADIGIARQVGKAVERHRKQQNAAPETCRRKRRLTTGVTGANNNDVGFSGDKGVFLIACFGE